MSLNENPGRFEIGFLGRATGVPPTGKFVILLTPEQFVDLPNGTELVNIFGEKKIKGRDYIDQDTCRGFLAYGIPEEDFA